MEGVGFVSGFFYGAGRLETTRAAVREKGSVTTMVATQGRVSKFEAMRKKFGVPKTEEASDNAGFSYEDFENAVSEYNYTMKQGDVVTGRIFDCSSRGALVDIGAKASAWLPVDEFATTLPAQPAEYFAPDTTMEFMVTSKEDMNGQLSLSLRRLEFQRCWDRVIQLQAEDVPVLVEIANINRGGCMVVVEGLRGFIPQSHAGNISMTEAETGRKVTAKFLEVDPEKSRVVLSRKLAVATNEMTNFQPGDVVIGRVSGVKPYGIFVDISGISGLLHISQISHDHIADVTTLLAPGSEVKCMILNQDKNKGRMSLSTKVLEQEPGDMVRDPQKVFEHAEEVAKRYKEKLEEERRASAEVAEEIVSALDFARVDGEIFKS
eukprot:Plantae.Rhodophyta-Purpureofilum_apyrenoidigerum.ctg1207.p1 GENE.Plantae.Rhodophyta-Purpureofilum_apyrenoidigerum.ctg1207~~Plantae.Rhodophyta-Purpureofilum_apyrenoidigerum.ctg1207.p1  ORF type:complete len:378 (+),score=73.93 Plantae.Rhodophyta-Purpureofilum_apyrenoidigerum.ctg1207:153-1286(+)